MRSAFTLIELLIILAVLGILAAIAVPMYSDSSDLARTETMAVNVGEIRTQIITHAAKGDVALSPGGHPTTVDGAWFRNNSLPLHAWTGQPLVLEVVNGGAGEMYPAQKTFAGAAPNAWYNATNGAFCVRVPAMRTDALTIKTFNDANKVGVTALNQTTN